VDATAQNSAKMDQKAFIEGPKGPSKASQPAFRSEKPTLEQVPGATRPQNGAARAKSCANPLGFRDHHRFAHARQ